MEATLCAEGLEEKLVDGRWPEYRNHKDTKKDTRFTKTLAGSWDRNTDLTDETDKRRFVCEVQLPDSGFQPWRRLEGKDRWSMVVARWPEEGLEEKIRLFIEALLHSTSSYVHKILLTHNANNLLNFWNLLNS